MPISLQFRLDVEDGWPPVGSESLPVEMADGGVEVLVAPMFIKDLSAHDVLDVKTDSEGYVERWADKKRSDHSTIWLLRISDAADVSEALEDVRSLGCNTARLDQFGCYSIDVPGTVPISAVDEILEGLKEDEVAIAYPSMRHPD